MDENMALSPLDALDSLLEDAKKRRSDLERINRSTTDYKRPHFEGVQPVWKRDLNSPFGTVCDDVVPYIPVRFQSEFRPWRPGETPAEPLPTVTGAESYGQTDGHIEKMLAVLDARSVAKQQEALDRVLHGNKREGREPLWYVLDANGELIDEFATQGAAMRFIAAPWIQRNLADRLPLRIEAA